MFDRGHSPNGSLDRIALCAELSPRSLPRGGSPHSGRHRAIEPGGSRMNRRLLGIRCALVALALSLVPAAPSAHAQLPPPPQLPGVNLAPVVNAGLDQVITLPGIATVTGAAIDDGLPIPPVLTTTWSQVSGPGTVSFSNPGALISTATFSESGAYVLRLTASDGALAAIDDVAVTVNPALPPITDKIDPALLALMAADPQRL